jgi:hypothetical protein
MGLANVYSEHKSLVEKQNAIKEYLKVKAELKVQKEN